MPDINDAQLNKTGSANVNISVWVASGQVYDGSTLVGDYTGQNALPVQQTISALPDDKQEQIYALILNELLLIQAGLR